MLLNATLPIDDCDIVGIVASHFGAGSYKKDNADLPKSDRPWVGLIMGDGRSVKVSLSVIDTPTALQRWNKDYGENYTHATLNPTEPVPQGNETVYRREVKLAYSAKEMRIDEMKVVSLLELPPVRQKKNDTSNVTLELQGLTKATLQTSKKTQKSMSEQLLL